MIQVIERARYYAATLTKIFEDIKLQLSQESIPIIVQLSNIEEICRRIAQDTSIDHSLIRLYMERSFTEESQILKLSNLYNSYISEATRAIHTSEELPRLSIANLSLDELDQKITIKPSNSISMTHGLLNKYLNYPIYADKTMFIKNVLDGINLCIIVTRPPKWGKTVNLQTLRLFLSCDLIEGKRILRDDFISKSKLAQHFPSYTDHMGKYPVIYLDLSSSSTLDLMAYKKLFKQQIIDSYNQHSRSIMNSEYASEELLEALGTKLENIDLESALIILAECLKAEYERDVYLLIDGADSHLVTMLNEGYSNESISDLAKIKTFMDHVLSKIHDAEIFRVVITGVYGSYFKDYPIASCEISRLEFPKDFTEDFGLTENEVENLLNEVLEECYIEKFLTCMKYWYNGYNLQNNKSKTIKLYSPHSTMSFLYKLSKDSTTKPSYSEETFGDINSATFDKYIGESGNFEILELIIAISTYTFSRESILGTIGVISAGRLANLNSKTILQMLYDLGYFTFLPDDRLIIPNLDAKLYIEKRIVYPWLQYKCKVENPTAIAKSLASVLRSTENFIKGLSKIEVFYEQSCNEMTYSAIIFGLLMLPRVLNLPEDVYEGEIEVNLQYNEGRLDSIFMPIHHNDTAVIHEYDIKETGLTYIDNAKMKLHQILDKGYMKAFIRKHTKYPHVKHVICRAIIINKFPFKLYGYSYTFNIQESIKLIEYFNEYFVCFHDIENIINATLGKKYTPEIAEYPDYEDLKRVAPNASSENATKKLKLNNTSNISL
jgi:hypothetical protein